VLDVEIQQRQAEFRRFSRIFAIFDSRNFLKEISNLQKVEKSFKKLRLSEIAKIREIVKISVSSWSFSTLNTSLESHAQQRRRWKHSRSFAIITFPFHLDLNPQETQHMVFFSPFFIIKKCRRCVGDVWVVLASNNAQWNCFRLKCNGSFSSL